MNKIPFILITGFLGSGKTTFLKNFLKKYNYLKIGVIQNEFAPTNVDSIELKSEKFIFNVLEINNGSALCVCNLANFIPSLLNFISNYNPEIIVMECSGLTDPSNILEFIENPEIKEKIFISKIFCIVNSGNIEKLLKINTRVVNQIVMADEILLNKIDLIQDETNCKNILEKIKEYNPFATVHLSQYCNIIPEVRFFNNTEIYREKIKNLEIQNTRPQIEVKVIKTVKNIDINRLKKVINENLEKLYRVKGIIVNDNANILVQFDGVQFNSKDINYQTKQNILVFIGNNLSEINFKELYNVESN